MLILHAQINFAGKTIRLIASYPYPFEQIFDWVRMYNWKCYSVVVNRVLIVNGLDRLMPSYADNFKSKYMTL